MFNKKEKRKNSEIGKNNRLHIIMTIVFLLSLALICKLFILQILKYDFYTGIASEQHQFFSKLSPKRGKIFMQDGRNDNEKLYPLATNKDFALIYAMPNKIEDPQKTAEAIYEILDKENVEKEVNKLLEEDEFFAISTSTSFLSAQGEKKIEEAFSGKKIEEFKEIKKTLEIEWRKEEILKKYFEKFSKKDDPYEPVKRKIEEDQAKKIMELKLPGMDYSLESFRYYPEFNIGSHISGFVGFNDSGMSGKYGLEGFFDSELSGTEGSIKAERSAEGEVIIISDREYKKPQDGSDLILTINRTLQFNACRELRFSVEKHQADGGVVVIMDPGTGALLAICSYPDFDPNNYSEVKDSMIFNNSAIFDAYEPGSIFKAFTMAAGLDQEKITPSSVYSDKGFIMVEGWDKPIKNSDYAVAGGHGVTTMTQALEMSLNTATIFVMEKVGPKIFSEYVKNFGFGEKTGIELETEGITNIENLNRKTFRPVEVATASFGQGITATPLQLVTAYAAIANGGILMKPYLVKEIRVTNDKTITIQPQQIRRVISERTSMLLSGMLVNVVDNGHSKLAGVKGYYVAGKTGTAQVAEKGKKGYGDKTIHSLVGYAPVDDPKFVMLTRLDNPKDARFAESSAAPLFGKLAEFLLNYYEVPKER